MALARLKRTPTFLLPLILRPILHPSSSSSSSSSQIRHHFSSATPPYLLSISQTHLHKHLFSSLEHFPSQILHEISDFEEDADKACLLDESGVDGFVEILKQTNQFSSSEEVMAFIDESGIQPSGGLVYSAIWALRHEWRLAFWAFKWGEKWGCNSLKAWGLMIWVLGNQRKFNIAWCLIRDMHRSSMSTTRAMLIMIDRYAAANDPCKAIKTFHTMEKFRMTPDMKSFHTLLRALCKHGNIEEAEEFMLLNRKLFPLETESFNIILDGWSNITVDVVEARRIWREMSKCCIIPDATSYTHMICCFSKVGNLFDSLRLYDEMKKRGWIPGLEVYNSLIHVLARENCLKEALNLLDTIKETGLQPDSATYNSLILPLCEAQKQEEAQSVLATMIRERINPTTETYHAFLEGVSLEGTLELLKRMKRAGCGPNDHTFLLILNKFFKLEQPGSAIKMWMEMKQYEVVPDSAHYTVLVQGLAACGWLTKAREFYAEMRSRGVLDDPKLKKLLKEPIGGVGDNGEGKVRRSNRGIRVPRRKGSMLRGKKSGNQSRKYLYTMSNDYLSSGFIGRTGEEKKVQQSENPIKKYSADAYWGSSKCVTWKRGGGCGEELGFEDRVVNKSKSARVTSGCFPKDDISAGLASELLRRGARIADDEGFSFFFSFCFSTTELSTLSLRCGSGKQANGFFCL
ncbi:hypothetical protein HHK36_013813 [Tetracentron sinense]|uniref:Pentatricopeptide repeat-containing protein n=1 Tax=Tetracentron sinense TaxID=13715 RepID=A0A834Z416_TETSI|nr:hypothetical protein HHK36_013813 [Tetracentron sinense]